MAVRNLRSISLPGNLSESTDDIQAMEACLAKDMRIIFGVGEGDNEKHEEKGTEEEGEFNRSIILFNYDDDESIGVISVDSEEEFQSQTPPTIHFPKASTTTASSERNLEYDYPRRYPRVHIDMDGHYSERNVGEEEPINRARACLEELSLMRGDKDEEPNFVSSQSDELDKIPLLPSSPPSPNAVISWPPISSSGVDFKKIMKPRLERSNASRQPLFQPHIFQHLTAETRTQSLPARHDFATIFSATTRPKKSALKRSSLKTTSTLTSSTVACTSTQSTISPGQSPFPAEDVSSSAYNDNNFKRTVSFTNLEIREYSIALSDHPGCSHGPPIQLGWEYKDQCSVCVEEYEQNRSPRRKADQLILSYNVRRYLLLKRAGYSSREVQEAMKEVERVKRGRLMTDLLWHASQLGETLEEFIQHFKTALFTPPSVQKRTIITRREV